MDVKSAAELAQLLQQTPAFGACPGRAIEANFSSARVLGRSRQLALLAAGRTWSTTPAASNSNRAPAALPAELWPRNEYHGILAVAASGGLSGQLRSGMPPVPSLARRLPNPACCPPNPACRPAGPVADTVARLSRERAQPLGAGRQGRLLAGTTRRKPETPDQSELVSAPGPTFARSAARCGACRWPSAQQRLDARAPAAPTASSPWLLALPATAWLTSYF